LGPQRKGGRAQWIAPVGDAGSRVHVAPRSRLCIGWYGLDSAGSAGDRCEGDSRPDGLKEFSAPRGMERAPADLEPHRGSGAAPRFCLPGPGGTGSAARFFFQDCRERNAPGVRKCVPELLRRRKAVQDVHLQASLVT